MIVEILVEHSRGRVKRNRSKQSDQEEGRVEQSLIGPGDRGPEANRDYGSVISVVRAYSQPETEPRLAHA